MSIEYSLIEHCAPTLASLKAASLFSIVSPRWSELELQTHLLNHQLARKGVALRVLPVSDHRALCYLYRTAMLSDILKSPDVADFLLAQGYHDLSLSAALDTLCARLMESEEFPHEIGIFLGYPLSDVVAFIENKGRDCVCCGCWKAYTNECEARKLFSKFEKCTRIYKKLYSCGRPLAKLTVAPSAAC